MNATRRRWIPVMMLVATLMTASMPAATADKTPDQLKSIIKKMTLEEKVGQLFVSHVYGETVDTTDAEDVAENQELYGVDNAAQLIDKYHLGGQIYFTWTNNLTNPKQIAKLSNGIQHSMLDQRLKIPGLVSTDQETGLVNRIGDPATVLPGNMALGAGRSKGDAKTSSKITGGELKAMGVNQNFAPDADVNVNPANPVIGIRSFSEDPQLTAKLTGAQVTGYQSTNVAAAAKHFPGHGDTDVDSHTGLPVIEHTREEWEKLDRPPFDAAVKAGADSIMSAHIVVPSLDPSGDPATLSKPILTGLLRKELGYQGVIVTDSLRMEGVREKYGDDRVPVLALKAGADQLLMPPDLDLAYKSVIKAVKEGELTEKRIDQSVYRILKLKDKRGLFEDPYVNPAAVDTKVGTPANKKSAQELTDRTPTLVRNSNKTLPFNAKPGETVLVAGASETATESVKTRLEKRGLTATALPTGSNPSAEQIAKATSAAKKSDYTVLLTQQAGVEGNEGQGKLVREVAATKKPVVAVGVRDAYDVNQFSGVRGFLATFGSTEPQLESAVKVLLGELKPQGKLPVTVPHKSDPKKVLYPLGHGLSY